MNTSPITVYRANMRHELGLIGTWVVMAKNVMGARELIWQLFKRDFMAGYKKSFLGMTWMLVAPLMGIASWLFLQKSGMLQPGDVGIPYPAYVLVGTSMWGLFVGLFNSVSSTLDAGTGLLMQVKYPHEALLFKQVAQQIATFTIGFALNIVVLFSFKVVPSWGILLLPLVALPLFFLASALGLMVSLVSAVAYDMRRAVELVIGLLMFTVPIIYSATAAGPTVKLINHWNPLTYIICSCRDMVIYGQLYHPKGYCIAAALSLLAFMISWRVFYVSEDKLIERMV